MTDLTDCDAIEELRVMMGAAAACYQPKGELHCLVFIWANGLEVEGLAQDIRTAALAALGKFVLLRGIGNALDQMRDFD